jgi:hypothetical protein
MGKIVNLTMAATLALALSAAPAWASHSGGGLCRILPILCKVGGTPPRAPEIDPSVARGTLAVLAGGVLMLAERRRRRR